MIDPVLFGCPAKSPEQIEQDYGLFYYTGYAIVYVYNCVTVPILMMLFSWWHMVVPVAEAPLVSKAALDRINEALMAINRVGIGAVVAYEEIIFLFMLFALLRFGKSMWSTSPRSDVPPASWKERVFLFAFAALAVAIGSSALRTLEMVKMARVKTLEYALVIMPAQVLVGLILASKAQWKWEQRAISKKATTKHVEIGVEEEKSET
jgi:hypothetical protein